MLHDSSNLLVHLRPAPVVARVATTTAAARDRCVDWLAREVDVARYLAERSVPVVGPAAELPVGPHLHRGFAITFWAYVDHDPGRSLDAAEVGEQRAREALDAAGLAVRALHGDAHAGNLLRTPDGPLWTDFEDTCRGPVEWDLACLACGRGPGAGALAAYGRRPDDPELAPFVEARSLQLAVWTGFVAQRRPELRERAREQLDALLA